MQSKKYPKVKLKGSPFSLDFPEASSTPKTNVTYLNESIFKKKLNREDFRAKLIKERSFQVYTKRSALGLVVESYCALVRSKNGIPAQFALVLDKGNQKRVVFTENGPRGHIVYASPTFNPFWDHLVNTFADLPENYSTSCVLLDSRLDSRLAQPQKNTGATTSTAQPTTQAVSTTQKSVPSTTTAQTAPKSAKPVAPAAEVLGQFSSWIDSYLIQNSSTRRAEYDFYKSGGDD